MVLDTLEILIEADRSGLESQLKRAGNSIQQFVSSMNKQEVSWTTILSKSITPALIGSIASTFAIAVSQALQFQDAMKTASLTSSSSFGDNTAAMSNSVYDMSAKTGQSANDIAGALGTVSQYYKDAATAQDILNVVTEEATIRNQNVVDVAKELVPLFYEWGVKTAPDASKATAVLNDAVKNGTVSFGDLVTGLTAAGPALKKYIDLGTAAAQTELVSISPGMDSKAALEGLATITNGITDKLATVNLLIGDMGTAVKTSGVSGAFDLIATKIQAAGGVANTLYGNIGLSTESIQKFKNASLPALADITTAAALLVKNAKSLDDQFNGSIITSDKLKMSWNSFVASLEKNVAPGLIMQMSEAIDGATTALNGLGRVFDDLFNGKIMEDVKQFATGDFWNILAENLANVGTFGIYGGVKDYLGLQNAQGGGLTSHPDQAATSNSVNHMIVNVHDSSGDPTIAGNKTAAAINQQAYSCSVR